MSSPSRPVSEWRATAMRLASVFAVALLAAAVARLTLGPPLY